MNTRIPMFLAAFAVACSDGSNGLDDSGVPDAGSSDTGVFIFPDATPVTPETPEPTLTGLSPNRGSEAGGLRVTLRGTAFLEPAQVWFAGTEATNVVVLDETSISATVPAGGGIGPVTVRVTTPGGSAELPDGFTYEAEVRIDAVEPARVPDEGGTAVTITGQGFEPGSLVLIDRIPLRGLVVENETTITGFMPAVVAGRPEVRLITPQNDARRSDVLFVFRTPELRDIAPGYGAIEGGDRQEIIGVDLEGTETIEVGSESVTAFELSEAGRMSFEAPPLAEGVYDVRVDNGDAQAVLSRGYIAYDPSLTDFAVLGLTPSRTSTPGLVTIVGRGFQGDTQVSIGGLSADVESVRNNTIEVTAPDGLAVGAHDVVVISDGELGQLLGAYTVFSPIMVSAIDPATGPAAGGTAVTIDGQGFVDGVEVRIAGVPLTNVQVVSDTQLTAETVAGSQGVFDVVVKSADTEGRLVDGFTMTEPFEIIRVEPDEGSIAGGTYVSILGRGLRAPVGVSFGGRAGVDPRLENGSVVSARTPPAPTGAVDVTLTTPDGEVTVPDAFRYFNPTLITGGAWGGPIEGAVNVSVINFQGNPIPGMAVQLGFDADPRYTAVTDANGLATVSSPEIRGAQTVTAGGPGVEFVTFSEINAQNVTMLASPHPQSQPPDAPIQPCPPPGGELPKIRGRVFKFKTSIDPVTQPDTVPLAQVTYTQANAFSPNPPMPPTQFAFVFEEGGEYEIEVTRAGSVAVYAILGDFNTVTNQFVPRRIGIATSVPVAPEEVTEGINIELDIPLDQTATVRLDSPPLQQPGPAINAVFSFLNLRSDGVIPFPAFALVSDTITITGLPALAGSEMFYMGGSFTQGMGGGLQQPFSLTFLETSASFEDGVDLGPFVEMPQNVTPKENDLVQGGVLSWDQGGVTPDLARVTVTDVRAVGGCCCDDANMNGECEEDEALQCGSIPQRFNRWSIFGPGNLQSFVMPQMPAGLQAFEPPMLYDWQLDQAVAPRFNYNEFVYNQFNAFFWRSWSTWNSRFLVKEETD